MIACISALALGALPLGDIAPLARHVEAEARDLRAVVDQADQPAFQAELAAFSDQAMALSQALRQAGLSDDLPCIFKGIAEDTLVKAEAVRTASPPLAPMARSQLAALLDDAIVLAPMAAAAASQNETKR